MGEPLTPTFDVDEFAAARQEVDENADLFDIEEFAQARDEVDQEGFNVDILKETRKEEQERVGYFNFAKLAYNRSITGMLQEAVTGEEPFDLSGFEPNFLEDVAATALSFFMPVDLVTVALSAGAGSVAARGITNTLARGLARGGVEKQVAMFAARKGLQKTFNVANRMIQSGITLGGITAAQSAAAQNIEGDISLSQVLQAGAGGALLGGISGGAAGVVSASLPPGLAGGLFGATAPFVAEIGAFGTVGPALEGRTPILDDYAHAAGVMLGIRSVHRTASAGLREYRKFLANEVREEKEVNGKTFDEATEIVARRDAIRQERLDDIKDQDITDLEFAAADIVLRGEEVIRATDVLDSKIASTVSFEQAIETWNGQRQAGAFLAKNVQDRMAEFMNKQEIPLENEKIINAIQAGEVERLSPAERNVAVWSQTNSEIGLAFAQARGILPEFRENYMHNIARGDRIEVANFAAKQGLGTVPGFAKPQTATFAELKEAGLDPISHMPILHGHWWSQYYKSIANQNLIDYLRGVPLANNLPIISNSRLPGYASLDLPGLRLVSIRTDPVTKKPISTTLSSAWVHPEFLEGMKAIADPSASASKVERGYERVRGAVKRLIMYNPLIHGWNIYSDVLDEVNFNVFKATKAVAGGGLGGKALTKLSGIEGKFERHLLMARSGISMDAVRNATAEFGEVMRTISPETATGIHRLRHPMKSLSQFSDKILWGNMVQHGQELVFFTKRSGFIKKGISEPDANRLAAHFTNDLLGTLPQIVFTYKQGKLLNSLFFARNWTISNLRLLTGAIGPKANNIKLPRFLKHKGLTVEEQTILMQEYQKHLVKGVMGMIVLSNIANLAFTGKLTTENEEGHALDIDTGEVDLKGRRIYVTPPLFRYIRDYFSWYGEPAKTFWNKLEPVSKTVIEQLINYEVWSRRPIAPAGAPFNDKALLRFNKTIRSLTPLGSLTPRDGEIRTRIEKYIPLFGTWVRRGVAGGDLRKQMIDFKQVKGYQVDKIDLELDEMIQSGDYNGFFYESISSGRYVDIDAMIRRMQRFKSPLVYSWRTMSKADRLLFLTQLSPEERKSLISQVGRIF